MISEAVWLGTARTIDQAARCWRMRLGSLPPSFGNIDERPRA
jgi:hypothetical protein